MLFFRRPTLVALPLILLADCGASGTTSSTDTSQPTVDSSRQETAVATDSVAPTDTATTVVTDSTVTSPTDTTVTVADTAVADTVIADTAVADTSVADTVVADTHVADTTVADTTVADTHVADTTVADTTVADVNDASTSCGVVPVDPNATPQAKKLLCYLYSIYGKQVLSGQQETSWDNPVPDITYIYQTTGKYPAVVGGDFLYAPTTNGGGAESMGTTAPPTSTTSRMVTYWNAGSIPLLCYHMGAPTLNDSYADAESAIPNGTSIDTVLTPGNAYYTSFTKKLDYAAAELLYLQQNNVAVLWRPFHEAGGTWFWWSMGTGAQYVALWKFMFNYFTVTKGIHNLVWLHPYDGSPNAAFYPGKAYVDVGGSDTYGTNPPFASQFTATKNIYSAGVPIALHETGTIVQPTTGMFPTTAPWVLFSVWAGYEQSANTPATLTSAYTSPNTVNRDGVPNLK